MIESFKSYFRTGLAWFNAITPYLDKLPESPVDPLLLRPLMWLSRRLGGSSKCHCTLFVAVGSAENPSGGRPRMPIVVGRSLGDWDSISFNSSN